MKVIVVGGGVAGSEAGTFLGLTSETSLDIVEVEAEPQRKFGGWGFQAWPDTETTNLAMRKMYLSEDPQDIFRWTMLADRSVWPEKFRSYEFHPDMTMPRTLMQEYVKWRRTLVTSKLTNYESVTGEAVRVDDNERIAVHMKDGQVIEGDRLVMASGSISVKVPLYIRHLQNHHRVIIDPLSYEGHTQRSKIPVNSRILILGTGLTGEEQVAVLLRYGHQNLSLFSRGGKRHFRYEEVQTNKELILAEPPAFLMAETPDEFDFQITEFFGHYLAKGHYPEYIFAAIRPFWEQVRKQLGGCLKAADRLRDFKRTLAVNSIGAPWEVSKALKAAESSGKLQVLNGHIGEVNCTGSHFVVQFEDGSRQNFDYIINAVGRNIIRHSIWEQMLEDGLAKKHAGIGVMVGETGRMFNKDEQENPRIWVVGMARAGDHALRHGFLGNTAFNVPQVRSHLYKTLRDLLSTCTR